jgi:hypothetical protein
MTFQASKHKIALLNKVPIIWQRHTIHLTYCNREGWGGPSILFVNGLRGAK